MNFNANATDDHLDDVTEDDIFQWATKYLPRPSAEAFTERINEGIGDWANGTISIHKVLTGAYQVWTGDSYPTP